MVIESRGVLDHIVRNAASKNTCGPQVCQNQYDVKVFSSCDRGLYCLWKETVLSLPQAFPRDAVSWFSTLELIHISAIKLSDPTDPTIRGEDTYVKSYLDCFLDNVFSVDEALYQSWANVVLINKSESQLKPDRTAYIKPWMKKFKITACEVKPPSKVGRGDISDFVKLGIEMRDMLNEIIDAGVDLSPVLGILVEGDMDFETGIYRMVQLGEFDLIEKKTQLGNFPALFTGLVQVKNICMQTAAKIEKNQRETAGGKRRNKANDQTTRVNPKLVKKPKNSA